MHSIFKSLGFFSWLLMPVSQSKSQGQASIQKMEGEVLQLKQQNHIAKGWAYRNGEGNGNPLQYSCLKNPVDRGAWWATVHRVMQSQTQLKRLIMHHASCFGEGNGNPLQYCCLENPRDRGDGWASGFGVTQSRTRLTWLSSSRGRAYRKGKSCNLLCQ